MLTPVIYYLVIYPVSLLPLPLLYVLSDFLYVLMYYLIPYRQKVVIENLTRSFPEKNSTEIKLIAKKFYRHFCDLLLESVKMFTITKEEVSKTFLFGDVDDLHRLYKEKKDVIVVSGHYNNWEMFAVAGKIGIPHIIYVIYSPLKDKWLDAKLKSARSKFGSNMLPMIQMLKMFSTPKTDAASYFFVMDQSPSNPNQCYWINFLNQDTGVYPGAEKSARHYNVPVLYYSIKKIKRGHYSVDIKLVTEDPKSMPKGQLTEKLMHLLEKDIKQAPEFWLWTHRRWKLAKPPEQNSEAVHSNSAIEASI